MFVSKKTLSFIGLVSVKFESFCADFYCIEQGFPPVVQMQRLDMDEHPHCFREKRTVLLRNSYCAIPGNRFKGYVFHICHHSILTVHYVAAL